MKFSQIFATLLVIGSTLAIDEYEGKEIVEKCYDELNEYDGCYPDYAEITEKELQDNCNVYKSEKCQNYWDDPIKFVPTCSEAIGYRSISRLNEMDRKRADYDEICSPKKSEKQKEEIINKCYDELNEYDGCYPDYAEVTEKELQDNCNVYKSEKCQNYWDDPIKFVPTCSEAIGYRSISRLNEMDRKRADYDEICLSLNKKTTTVVRKTTTVVRTTTRRT